MLRIENNRKSLEHWKDIAFFIVLHQKQLLSSAEGVQKLAMKKNSKYDPAVGVSEIKKVGTQVKQGEPLMMIHYNEESKMEEALEYLKGAYRLAPKRPSPPELIVERVA